MTSVAHDPTPEVAHVAQIPLGTLRDDADQLAPGQLDLIVAKLLSESNTPAPRAMFNSSP